MKFLVKYYLVFLFFAVASPGITQELHFSFDFDDCSFEDSNSKFPGITPGSNLLCTCGLGAKSVSLDGNDDFLTFSKQVNPLLDSNFTFDFYFSMEGKDGETDIFSLRNGCTGLDSLMALRYSSATNELVFEIGSSVNNYYTVRKQLSKSLCWHRFTLVKFGLIYFVFIDNQLAKKIIAKESINFSRQANLHFANSPCNSINQAGRYKGMIDEIKLYKRALSEQELLNLFKFPDQIVTPNTTIFKGESIKLEIGESCATSVIWSPTSSLDKPKEFTPIATPTTTTTFSVMLDNGKCIAVDTVTIFVADKDKQDCKKLLLPKAFTPNNDGLNDNYGISNTFLIEKLDFFEIYDRWGAKIWETKNITEKWDGSFNGKPVNNGMYLYKIKYTCKGEINQSIDNFSLIR